MVAKLYSWDDAGAPVLSDVNDGSLLSILRACLIDGYGTRTAAGWTMPFSDIPNRKAIFKPVASPVYLRLDDNYSYQYAYVRGYGTMSDVDTGTEQFPRDADMVAGYHYAVSKKYTTGTDYAKWHVVADDEWFYFIVHHLTGSYPCGFFFGKIDHVDATYPNPYLITGHEVSVSLTSSFVVNGLFNPTEWWLKETYTKIGVPEGIRFENDGGTSSYANPNPITGKIEMGSPGDLVRFVTTPYIRHGTLPKYHKALGINTVIYKSADKLIINAVKYLVVMYNSRLIMFEYDQEVG